MFKSYEIFDRKRYVCNVPYGANPFQEFSAFRTRNPFARLWEVEAGQRTEVFVEQEVSEEEDFDFEYDEEESWD